MTDLATGLALVLVLEGLLWALAPGLGRRMLEELVATPEPVIRTIAWSMVAAGCVIVWLVRG